MQVVTKETTMFTTLEQEHSNPAVLLFNQTEHVLAAASVVFEPCYILMRWHDDHAVLVR